MSLADRHLSSRVAAEYGTGGRFGWQSEVDTIALPSYAKLGIHYYLLSDVIETVAHEYEFIKLNIPIGNDRCLRQQYGEYMRLPPIEQRGIHHDFIVFYDPDKPYSDYKNSSILKRYFDGDVSLELL